MCREMTARNEERCTRFYTHLEPEGKSFVPWGKRFHSKVLKILMFNNRRADWIKLCTLSMKNRNSVKNWLSYFEIHCYVDQRVTKHTPSGKR